MEKEIFVWNIVIDEINDEFLKIIKVDKNYYAQQRWSGWLGRCPNPYCEDPWGCEDTCTPKPAIWISLDCDDFYFPFWRVKLTRQLRKKMKKIAPYIGRARIKYQK